ncbi:MAG: hypothetical protein UT90_C0003G0034 [Parcubacteria group bacterium GW2011_GWA1_40_21]|nr:MAG: hypothetical protein UT90_C0003G0034 [Parcubacteria group bacterium GW2011_GWA1_40_21]
MMKIKKFLKFYMASILFVFIPFLVLQSGKGAEQEQINTQSHKIKKIVVIITEEFEPRGRAICETANGVVYGDWMDVENAIVERKIMKVRFGKSNKFWIQYDKWPY